MLKVDDYYGVGVYVCVQYVWMGGCSTMTSFVSCVRKRFPGIISRCRLPPTEEDLNVPSGYLTGDLLFPVISGTPQRGYYGVVAYQSIRIAIVGWPETNDHDFP